MDGLAPPSSIGNGSSAPLNGTEDLEAQLPPELIDPYKVLGLPDILPGWEGAPFRGKKIPDLKEDDPRQVQPQQGIEAHVEVLVLGDPVQRKRYQNIMQIIANGFGHLGKEEMVYDAEIKNWRVMIRWWQIFSHLPEKRG